MTELLTSGTYWIGVATLPLISAAVSALFVGWWRAEAALDRRGITVQAKVRDTSKISDYTLRNDIWWERSFGPVFVGGWYREQMVWQQPDKRLATRWVGLGSADGPCLMVLRMRELATRAEVHA